MGAGDGPAPVYAGTAMADPLIFPYKHGTGTSMLKDTSPLHHYGDGNGTLAYF